MVFSYCIFNPRHRHLRRLREVNWKSFVTKNIDRENKQKQAQLTDSKENRLENTTVSASLSQTHAQSCMTSLSEHQTCSERNQTCTWRNVYENNPNLKTCCVWNTISLMSAVGWKGTSYGQLLVCWNIIKTSFENVYMKNIDLYGKKRQHLLCNAIR